MEFHETYQISYKIYLEILHFELGAMHWEVVYNINNLNLQTLYVSFFTTYPYVFNNNFIHNPFYLNQINALNKMLYYDELVNQGTHRLTSPQNLK